MINQYPVAFVGNILFSSSDFQADKVSFIFLLHPILAMAERYPEAEKPNCPLCSKAFESWRAVRGHLDPKNPGKAHKDLEKAALQEALDSVPTRDICPFCNKKFAQVHQHQTSCPANPKNKKALGEVSGVDPSSSLLIADPYAGKSNADFEEAMKQRLLKRERVMEKTADQYMRFIKKFIELETAEDPQFVAWQWLMVGTKAEPDPRFRELRVYQDYSEHLITNQGSSTHSHMEAAYRHLLRWVKGNWNASSRDPASAIERCEASLEEARKGKVKGGPLVGQGKKSSKGDSTLVHLDLSIVYRVRQTFFDSNLRRETLQRFRDGKFTSPKVEIMTLEEAGCFLTLELYLTQGGTRMDVVQNMTLSMLLEAKHALQECPYCKVTGDYAAHKEQCLERPRRAGRTDYDSDSEASRQVGMLWRVPVPNHKTARSAGTLEVMIRNELLNIVRRFVRVRWGTQGPGDVKLFKEYTWYRQRTILGRIIKAENPSLWALANPNPTGPEPTLPLNAFRRLALNCIDEESDPRKQDKQLRSVGTSKDMLDKVYKDSRDQSLQRSKAVLEIGGGRPILPDEQPVTGKVVALLVPFGPSTSGEYTGKGKGKGKRSIPATAKVIRPSASAQPVQVSQRLYLERG